MTHVAFTQVLGHATCRSVLESFSGGKPGVYAAAIGSMRLECRLRGRNTLAELSDGRSQSVINHFMLGPGWKEGCVGCSFGADHMVALCIWSTTTTSRSPQRNWRRARSTTTIKMTDGGMEA
jgi:hypothetical protein